MSFAEGKKYFCQAAATFIPPHSTHGCWKHDGLLRHNISLVEFVNIDEDY
jgi:hypothetical protein